MPRRPAPSALRGPSTRASAAAEGVGDWQLRHRDVVRLSRDTYLPSEHAAHLRTRLPAVLLTAPPGAVVSHRSAAALWGVEVPLQPADPVVDLTVPAGSRARNRRDRRLHRSALAPGDVGRRWQLPLTTPARTWRDLAAVLPCPALLAVTDQLLGLLCTPEDLARALAARPTGHGAARARRVLAVADPRVDSPMESVLRWLVHEAGLPRPTLQHRVVDGAGRLIGLGDMAWPDRRVLVEFDGEVHRERRVFVNDLRRQNRLVLEGWTVLRFTSADVLGRPQDVVATIARALTRWHLRSRGHPAEEATRPQQPPQVRTALGAAAPLGGGAGRRYWAARLGRICDLVATRPGRPRERSNHREATPRTWRRPRDRVVAGPSAAVTRGGRRGEG